MSYKWFSDKEVAGLTPDTATAIDNARGILGLPIVITFTNGGQHCGHSAHYLGLAADLGLGHLAEGSERDAYRFLLTDALIQAGFRRIEQAPVHIHCDKGQLPDYPSPCMWIGQEA